jgi:hypothetical protein
MTPITRQGILSHKNAMRLIYELLKITRKHIIIFVLFGTLNWSDNLKMQEVHQRLKLNIYLNCRIIPNKQKLMKHEWQIDQKTQSVDKCIFVDNCIKLINQFRTLTVSFQTLKTFCRWCLLTKLCILINDKTYSGFQYRLYFVSLFTFKSILNSCLAQIILQIYLFINFRSSQTLSVFWGM